MTRLRASPMVLVLLAACGGSAAPTAPPTVPRSDPREHGSDGAPPGYLVVAPDRGFLGNDLFREQIASLPEDLTAELVFVTDERTVASVEQAARRLAARGASGIVVVPFFVSASHPKLELLRGLLAEHFEAVRWALPFGKSYLCVELVADELRAVDDLAGRPLVVVGHGARDDASTEAMERDLGDVARRAAEGFGTGEIEAIVFPDSSSPDANRLRARAHSRLEAAAGAGAVVLPLHLGPLLDSMMSFAAELERFRSSGAGSDLAAAPLVGTWLRREVHRFAPLDRRRVGVVALAHGGDFHWNEGMRRGLAPVAERYLLEPAFSMADRSVVERAVHRLEERGARYIVVVRIFGLESSFRGAVERMLGLDIETPSATASSARGHEHGAHWHGAHGQGAHGHGHGSHTGQGHAPDPPEPRIRSSAVVTTAGGLEDHPLFARALLSRAQELSRDPGVETVVLVAHGAGEEHRNAHWMNVLRSLAAQMRELGGQGFRAIEVGTWREDWPEVRDESVAAVRDIVASASRDGGRVLVIPARTNGTGPERDLLRGLDFELGQGFAPHPLFADWVAEQVELGLSQRLLPPGGVAPRTHGHRHGVDHDRSLGDDDG